MGVTIILPWGGGAVLTTVSGRTTTPTPKQVDPRSPGSTSRKVTNSLKCRDKWLLENAIEEARSRGRQDLVRAWSSEEVSKHGFPPATFASMFSYLFEWRDMVDRDKQSARLSPRPLTNPAE